MTLAYNYDPAKFKNLSNFQTKSDFNKNYEMIIADHSKIFSKCELNFLRVYKRFAVKVFGVVTAKIKTVVAAATEKYGLKTSVRTAKRALEKAQAIGLLKLHETRSPKTGLKGPSIAQFQIYKNGTTLEIAKTLENNDSEQTNKSKMAPHKTSLTETSIKKYYIRKGAEGFKSIAVKMTVKKEQHIKTELITTPIKDKESFKPLKFISRLKDVVYRSLMNTKEDAKAIIEIVHANVYNLTKFDMYKPMTDSLLEKSLRIVEITLQAHKRGSLDHIKSIRGFIDSLIKAELQAVTEYQLNKTLNVVTTNTSESIVRTYTDALEANKAPLYNWLED